MYYRRRLGEDCHWHWHPRCSQWPNTSYFETWIGAGLDFRGGPCTECMAIDRVLQVLRHAPGLTPHARPDVSRRVHGGGDVSA